MQASDTESTEESGDVDHLILMQTVKSWMESGWRQQVRPPEKTARKVRLMVIEYVMGAEERRVTLRPGQIQSFGRNSSVDQSVPLDPCISGQHFTIHCEAAGGYIHDLGSSNGTFVNGDRVIQADLANGDLIVAGMTLFKVSCSYM